MKNEKRNPPSVVETEGGRGTNSAGRAALQTVPDGDFITPNGSGQGSIPFRIEDYLLRGRDSSIKIAHLEQITGLRARQISQAVQEARRRGVPVLSSSHPGGYFIAATEEEKKRFLKSMGHRAKEIIATLRCLEQAKVEETDGRRRTV